MATAPLEFNGINFLLAENHVINARELFIQWYKKEAIKRIKERVDFYSSITGLKYRKISITNARHRWGSCNGIANLCFTWRLIMAPLEIIDYVIVHEIFHIEVKNHSKDFWQKVESFIPEYKKCRKWLTENQNLLLL